jgi:hypothetical protein
MTQFGSIHPHLSGVLPRSIPTDHARLLFLLAVFAAPISNGL